MRTVGNADIVLLEIMGHLQWIKGQPCYINNLGGGGGGGENHTKKKTIIIIKVTMKKIIGAGGSPRN